VSRSIRARCVEEAEWWERASPRERLAFFLGTQRGMGYAWPGTAAVRQLKVRFGITTTPAPRVAAAERERNVPCPHDGCPVLCVDLRGLAAHLRSHETAPCDKCGRTFIRSGLGPHRARCTGATS
jgi:hypothetical protein